MKEDKCILQNNILNSTAKYTLKNSMDYHLLLNIYCFAIHEQKVDKQQGLGSHLCLWLTAQYSYLSVTEMVTQLPKLHFVDKLGKSEFEVGAGGRLELSTRIRKQNVVLVFLGFKTILLAFGELKGRNPILVILVLPIENTPYSFVHTQQVHQKYLNN